MSLLYVIIVGGIAGWLASLLVKGHGAGIVINIILGIIGAFVGQYILKSANLVGLFPNLLIFDLVSGTVGAVVVLFIASLINK